MARDTWTYIDAESTSTVLSADPYRVIDKELKGFGMGDYVIGVQQVPFVDGADDLTVYLPPRELLVPITVEKSTYDLCRVQIETLALALYPGREPAEPAMGAGKLRRVTTDSRSREIGVRYTSGCDTAKFEDLANWRATLLLNFVAPYPYFQDTSDTQEQDNFNGSTPVNIACNNTGHIPVWPVVTIAGPVNTPTLTLGSLFLTLNYNIANGQSVTIDFRFRRKSATYSTTPTNLTPYITPASTFWRLARGNNTVSISATSGSGLCTITWRCEWLSML